MKPYFLWPVIFCVVVILSACGGGGGDDSTPIVSPTPEVPPPVAPPKETPPKETPPKETPPEGPSLTTYTLTGEAVKGPLAYAEVAIYAVNFESASMKGELLATTTTHIDGRFSDISLNVEEPALAYLIEVTATPQTIDITTGQAPVFSTLQSLVSGSAIQVNTPVLITPLTHLITQATAHRATRIEDAIVMRDILAQSVLQYFSFGATNMTDPFSTGALASNEIDKTLLLEHRTIIEGITALLFEVAQSAGISVQTLSELIARDLSDGVLNNQAATEQVDGFSIDDLMGAAVPALVIPNTDQDGDLDTDDPFVVSQTAELLQQEQQRLDSGIDLSLLTTDEFVFIPAPLGVDFDKDGIPDSTDDDDDNDGVTDVNDVFPLDDSESNDIDSDGVGDNADAYPGSAQCHRLSDGNGVNCWVNILANQHTVQVLQTESWIVYANLPGNYHYEPGASIVVVQDKATGFIVQSFAGVDFKDITVTANGEIWVINDNDDIGILEKNTFKRVYSDENGRADSLIGLTDSVLVHLNYAGGFILRGNGDMGETYSLANHSRSGTVAYNSELKSLYISDYFRLDGIVKYQVDETALTIELSPQNIKIDGSQSEKLWIDAKNSRLLTESGTLLNAESLAWLAASEYVVIDALATSDGSWNLLTEQSGNVVFVRLDPNLALQQTVPLPNSPQALFKRGDNIVAVTRDASAYVFHEVAITNDSDGDGVPDTQDAFPNNPSAATDSDADGYPDERLNVGSGANNLLMVDAYPDNAACAITGQECRLSPDAYEVSNAIVFSDYSDIIYILSQTRQKLYRYNVTEQTYLNPVNLARPGTNAVTGIYHTEHDKVYIGYSSGAIVSVAPGEQISTVLTVLEAGIDTLLPAENYLVGIDNKYNTSVSYSIGKDGIIRDRLHTEHGNAKVGYLDASSMLVTLLWDNYELKLNRQLLDQQAGLLLDSENVVLPEQYYHYRAADVSNTLVNDSFWLSDGALISLDTNSFNDKTVPAHDIALGFSNTVVTLETTTSQLMYIDNNSIEVVYSREYDSVIGLVKMQDDAVVVLFRENEPEFVPIEVSDSDNDSLPGWWESLYGLDDSDALNAQLDTDSDGLNNLQEYAAGTNPIDADTDADGVADNDEISLYQTSPLLPDTDGDGLSDSEEIFVTFTSPLFVDTDNDSLSDYDEVILYQSNPLTEDTDGDTLPDSYEVAVGLQVNVADNTADSDNDGLSNEQEFAAGTHPLQADTDFDQLSDSDELALATDPLNFDTDADRIPDGIEVNATTDPLTPDSTSDLDNDGFYNVTEYFTNTLINDITQRPVAPFWRYDFQSVRTFSLAEVSRTKIPVQRFMVNYNTLIGPQQTGDERQIYALSTDNDYVSAFDNATGELVWSKALSTDSYNQHSIFAFEGGVGVIGGGEYFIFDTTDGTLLETIDLVLGTSYQLRIDNSVIYLKTSAKLAAFSLAGEKLWQYTLSVSHWGPLKLTNTFVVLKLRDGYKVLDRQTGAEVSDLTLPESSYIIDSGSYDNLLIQAGSSVKSLDLHSAKITDLFSNDGYYSLFASHGLVYTFVQNELNIYNEVNGELVIQVPDTDVWSWSGDLIVTQDTIVLNFSDKIIAYDLLTSEAIFEIDVEIGSTSKIILTADDMLLHFKNSTLTGYSLGKDTDGDTIDDWWENRYGLDATNAADAQNDSDSDGLINVDEFAQKTRPDVVDTDGDTLSDGDEFHIHSTDPLSVDTDNDHLSDSEEISIYLTSPVDADSDQDGFSDNAELFIYDTDPNSDTAIPEPLLFLEIDFENSIDAKKFSKTVDSDASWRISDTDSVSGNASFKSGQIFHNQSSATEITLLTSAGSLSFNLKVDSEACCDDVTVFVDDVYFDRFRASQWQNIEINLLQGQHTIRWEYRKDGSVNTGEDSVWIDDVVFSAGP